MRLTHSCSVCTKPLVETSVVRFLDGSKIQSFKCGHSFFNEPPKRIIPRFTSVLGDKLARTYQESGIEFIINSDFNCILADQMRLGKTPQFLLACASDPERRPILIIVKSANLYQWMREYKEWTDPLPLGIFPIQGSTSFIPPGFAAYIISMDTFSRPGMVDRLLSFGFKLCGVDEAHSFKNTKTKRYQALVSFLKRISEADIVKTVPLTCPLCRHSWDKQIKITVTKTMKSTRVSDYCPNCNAFHFIQASLEEQEKAKCCGIVLLTGTPIKNKASEYGTLLNIVAPEQFPIQRFNKEWLETGGKQLKSWRIDAFKTAISPFVLRREKEDVYTDLPLLNRMYTVIEVTDQRLKDAYNKVLDKIEEDSKQPDFTFFSSLAELIQLRQIAALAKIQFVSEYTDEMLEDSDNARIAIGLHHYVVANQLQMHLAKWGVLGLSGKDNSERKDWIMRNFETSRERVLLINSLAGGLGMDFHYCNNVICIERQWSPADDEQFEFRFYNPDKSIKTAATNIEYILAKGTLDEWWHEMLRAKYTIYGETIGTNWDPRKDPKAFKELIKQTVGNRL